ncbi:hypothetical protein EES43_07230 [Streptomyces sp. ADI96-02]|uniref:hypothetical protein n=1 Tax=Streptomyces sp. ADI96-02 TaxID=1522760 RepID=UPI000F557E57|nr:hypothetical protein [Streptomyces sp. ADI96-02]RPK65856.1 hypothetical protein EES43_07230 [Streptomyces sp. ADI96-02]
MIALSATDVRTCEACWNAPATAARHTAAGRDLLCEECAQGDYPRRVDLFPPFGVYGLTARKVLDHVKSPADDGVPDDDNVLNDGKVLNDGRHGSGPPRTPPDPGPPLPTPPPPPSPPGTPPV